MVWQKIGKQTVSLSRVRIGASLRSSERRNGFRNNMKFSNGARMKSRKNLVLLILQFIFGCDGMELKDARYRKLGRLSIGGRRVPIIPCGINLVSLIRIGAAELRRKDKVFMLAWNGKRYVHSFGNEIKQPVNDATLWSEIVTTCHSMFITSNLSQIRSFAPNRQTLSFFVKCAITLFILEKT